MNTGRWAWVLAIEIVLFTTPLLLPDGIPVAAAAIFYAAAIVLAVFAGYKWQLKRRIDGQAWPGVAAHFIVRLKEGQEKRRRYLFDYYKEDGASLAMYLSASDVFTISVTDVNGEIYTLETSVGRRGMPIAQWMYVAAEVAQLPKYTKLSLDLNGAQVSERLLPIVLNLGDDVWGKHGALGADRNGQNNGKFDLGEFILRAKTLARNEQKQLLTYLEKKWKVLD